MYVAIDTETTGLDIFQGAKPFLFIVSYNPDYLEIPTSCGRQFIRNGVKTTVTKDINEILPVLHNKYIEKVFHNAFFDLKMFKSIGVEVFGKIHDTMIAKHLLDSQTLKSLSYCMKTELGEKKEEQLIDDFFNTYNKHKSQKILKSKRNYSFVPDDIIFKYAAMDGFGTFKLWEIYRERLSRHRLLDIYNIEIELLPCLLQMHYRGMQIDEEYFLNLKNELNQQAKKTKEEIFKFVGKEFDINSTDQLAKILQDSGVKLPETEKSNFKKRRYSTSKQTLSTIKHPLVDLINENRRILKFNSTYVEGILKRTTNGIIHPDFNQTACVTGRMSESLLMLLPKKDKTIRQGFINKKGRRLLPIDFAQQELRVFLGLSNEKKAIEEINKGGWDGHQFMVDTIKLLKTRDQAKTFNFSIIYGVGDYTLGSKLCPDLHPSKWKNIGASVKKEFWKIFPGSKHFCSTITEELKNNGYVESLFGRKVPLDYKNEAYKAINYKIQGSCANYTKKKMVDIFNALKKEDVYMICQVHDELLFDFPENNFKALKTIKEIMEDSKAFFNVKLEVDISIINESWAKKETFIE